LPELADHGDGFLEHVEALLRARPAVAEDVLVQVLAAADAEEETPGKQAGRRRGGVRDDRRMDPHRRAGDARADRDALGRLGDRERPESERERERDGERDEDEEDDERDHPRTIPGGELSKRAYVSVKAQMPPIKAVPATIQSR